MEGEVKRKYLKWAAAGLVVVVVGLSWSGCSRSGSGPTPAPQVVTVKRGNITTVITGSGNLAFSKTQDLVFSISGKVAELNIKLGDNVTEGQVLARLDTTDLDAAVSSADLAVKSARIDLNTAELAKSNIANQELAVQSAQLSLRTAEQAQSSIATAGISLENAQNALAKLTYPYTYATFAFDVPAALVSIHEARLNLNLAAQNLKPDSPDYGVAMMKFRDAQTRMLEAEERLGRGIDIQTLIKATDGTEDSTGRMGSIPWNTTDYWTLRSSQLTVENARIALTNAENSYKNGVDNANLTLVKAQQSLKDARESYPTGLDRANVSLQTAQSNLEKAKRNQAKATLTAPFSGIATAVNISGGQEINAGQVVIAIADPNQLEAKVLVNEVDIPWVLESGSATLAVDAVSALNLPASVTQVAPTATVQQGVVNYTVTIGVQSNVVDQSVDAGQPRPTQRPGQQSGQQAGQRSGQTRSSSRGAQAGAPASIKLRQGLSVSASITKQQGNNVLLVPAAAVIAQGTNRYLTVVKPDGTTERVQVQIGLTDGANTEIIEGVAEGDSVQIPVRTTGATSTPTFRPGGGIGGGIRIG